MHHLQRNQQLVGAQQQRACRGGSGGGGLLLLLERLGLPLSAGLLPARHSMLRETVLVPIARGAACRDGGVANEAVTVGACREALGHVAGDEGVFEAILARVRKVTQRDCPSRAEDLNVVVVVVRVRLGQSRRRSRLECTRRFRELALAEQRLLCRALLLGEIDGVHRGVWAASPSGQSKP
eukprot:6238609-Prymnesium_polylepis.3